MSNLVSAKVHKKVFGSAKRKAVMIYFANKASDGGEGIWSSKTTIAAEMELARSTVIKTINELVAAGILIVVGDRRHRNGATVEYDISMDAVDRLPDVELPRQEPNSGRGDHGATRPVAGPVRQSDLSECQTPPVRLPDSMVSESRTQTILKPSLNQDDDDGVRDADGFRGKILEAMGLEPDRRTALGGPADMAEARRWLDLPHVTEDRACEQIRAVMARKGDGPPHSLGYFTDEMRRMSANLEASMAPLAPAPRRQPNRGEAVPMAARQGEIDLDGLSALWAPKLAGGAFVPSSAISPLLARHMLDKGMVAPSDLRRVGVTV